MSGVKGYERKLKESKKPGGRRLHRTSAESRGTRIRKKLLDKNEWFKKRSKSNSEEKSNKKPPPRTKQPKQRLQSNFSTVCKPVKTRSVIFVEQTKDGRLAKDIREVLLRLEGMLGFKFKVVERAGAALKRILPNTNPWAGAHCSRIECLTCNQGVEEFPNCTKRSLVYENICLKCNPEASNKGELKNLNNNIPSVYVGETSRSVQERAMEHQEALKNKSNDSHMYKHWLLHHPGEEQPRFIMKVVQFHRTALSRQVGEAVRIAKRGRDTPLLNSRGEYNRCSITRLSLEQVTSDMKGEPEQGWKEGEEDLDKDWTAGLLQGRDQRDRLDRQGLGRAEKSCGSKREGSAELPLQRRKKRKYALGKEDWGVTGGEGGADKSSFLYSGLEGVRGIESGGTIGKSMNIETALRNAAENQLKKTMFLGELAEHSACDDTTEG